MSVLPPGRAPAAAVVAAATAAEVAAQLAFNQVVLSLSVFAGGLGLGALALRRRAAENAAAAAPADPAPARQRPQSDDAPLTFDPVPETNAMTLPLAHEPDHELLDALAEAHRRVVDDLAALKHDVARAVDASDGAAERRHEALEARADRFAQGLNELRAALDALQRDARAGDVRPRLDAVDARIAALADEIPRLMRAATAAARGADETSAATRDAVERLGAKADDADARADARWTRLDAHLARITDLVEGSRRAIEVAGRDATDRLARDIAALEDRLGLRVADAGRRATDAARAGAAETLTALSARIDALDGALAARFATLDERAIASLRADIAGLREEAERSRRAAEDADARAASRERTLLDAVHAADAREDAAASRAAADDAANASRLTAERVASLQRSLDAARDDMESWRNAADGAGLRAVQETRGLAEQATAASTDAARRIAELQRSLDAFRADAASLHGALASGAARDAAETNAKLVAIQRALDGVREDAARWQRTLDEAGTDALARHRDVIDAIRSTDARDVTAATHDAAERAATASAALGPRIDEIDRSVAALRNDATRWERAASDILASRAAAEDAAAMARAAAVRVGEVAGAVDASAHAGRRAGAEHAAMLTATRDAAMHAAESARDVGGRFTGLERAFARWSEAATQRDESVRERLGAIAEALAASADAWRRAHDEAREDTRTARAAAEDGTNAVSARLDGLAAALDAAARARDDVARTSGAALAAEAAGLRAHIDQHGHDIAKLDREIAVRVAGIAESCEGIGRAIENGVAKLDARHDASRDLVLSRIDRVESALGEAAASLADRIEGIPRDNSLPPSDRGLIEAIATDAARIGARIDDAHRDLRARIEELATAAAPHAARDASIGALVSDMASSLATVAPRLDAAAHRDGEMARKLESLETGICALRAAMPGAEGAAIDIARRVDAMAATLREAREEHLAALVALRAAIAKESERARSDETRSEHVRAALDELRERQRAFHADADARARTAAHAVEALARDVHAAMERAMGTHESAHAARAREAETVVARLAAIDRTLQSQLPSGDALRADLARLETNVAAMRREVADHGGRAERAMLDAGAEMARATREAAAQATVAATVSREGREAIGDAAQRQLSAIAETARIIRDAGAAAEGARAAAEAAAKGSATTTERIGDIHAALDAHAKSVTRLAADQDSHAAAAAERDASLAETVAQTARGIEARTQHAERAILGAVEEQATTLRVDIQALLRRIENDVAEPSRARDATLAAALATLAERADLIADHVARAEHAATGTGATIDAALRSLRETVAEARATPTLDAAQLEHHLRPVLDQARELDARIGAVAAELRAAAEDQARREREGRERHGDILDAIEQGRALDRHLRPLAQHVEDMQTRLAEVHADVRTRQEASLHGLDRMERSLDALGAAARARADAHAQAASEAQRDLGARLDALAPALASLRMSLPASVAAALKPDLAATHAEAARAADAVLATRHRLDEMPDRTLVTHLAEATRQSIDAAHDDLLDSQAALRRELQAAAEMLPRVATHEDVSRATGTLAALDARLRESERALHARIDALPDREQASDIAAATQDHLASLGADIKDSQQSLRRVVAELASVASADDVKRANESLDALDMRVRDSERAIITRIDTLPDQQTARTLADALHGRLADLRSEMKESASHAHGLLHALELRVRDHEQALLARLDSLPDRDEAARIADATTRPLLALRDELAARHAELQHDIGESHARLARDHAAATTQLESRLHDMTESQIRLLAQADALRGDMLHALGKVGVGAERRIEGLALRLDALSGELREDAAKLAASLAAHREDARDMRQAIATIPRPDIDAVTAQLAELSSRFDDVEATLRAPSPDIALRAAVDRIGDALDAQERREAARQDAALARIEEHAEREREARRETAASIEALRAEMRATIEDAVAALRGELVRAVRDAADHAARDAAARAPPAPPPSAPRPMAVDALHATLAPDTLDALDDIHDDVTDGVDAMWRAIAASLPRDVDPRSQAALRDWATRDGAALLTRVDAMRRGFRRLEGRVARVDRA